MREAETNHSKAFPPTLPTTDRSPNFAMPTTRVVKTRGAMTICTNLKKIVVSSLMLVEKDLMDSGEDCVCTRYPVTIPNAMAIRI